MIRVADVLSPGLSSQHLRGSEPFGLKVGHTGRGRRALSELSRQSKHENVRIWYIE